MTSFQRFVFLWTTAMMWALFGVASFVGNINIAIVSAIMGVAALANIFVRMK